MQLTSEDRLKFYRRTGLSAGIFILLFSAGMNIFLLATRVPADATLPSAPAMGEESLLPGAQAYGRVDRGFAVRIQQTVGTSAVLPVSGYALSADILPKLSAALPLFRDQGIPADAGHMSALLKKMGLPLPWESLGLLPLQEKWRSADRTMEFVLDLEKRSLTVAVLGSFGPSPEGRADDAVTIAIADRFISQFTIDRAGFRAPYIVEKVPEGGGPSRTYVVWAMSFNGLPLIDTYGQPVPAAQVQVGRLSRRALSATFTLLSADSLTRSAYPRASTEQLRKGFLSGGVLPAPKAARGVNSVANFVASQEVYVLLPADKEHPTYVVPGIYAVWMQPACDGCGLMPVPTFLPSLDPEQFRWFAAPPSELKPVQPVSSSASGSVKAGTGTAAQPKK